MQLHGNHLVLTSASLEDASRLVPAFNGDTQFNMWCGYTSDWTLEQVRADMLVTFQHPDGMVWQIAEQMGGLVGVAKTALLSAPDMAWIDLLIIRGAFQRRGYGAEAARLLETYFFSYSQITQIALAVLIQIPLLRSSGRSEVTDVENITMTLMVMMSTAIFCLVLHLCKRAMKKEREHHDAEERNDTASWYHRRTHQFNRDN